MALAPAPWRRARMVREKAEGRVPVMPVHPNGLCQDFMQSQVHAGCRFTCSRHGPAGSDYGAASPRVLAGRSGTQRSASERAIADRSQADRRRLPSRARHRSWRYLSDLRSRGVVVIGSKGWRRGTPWEISDVKPSRASVGIGDTAQNSYGGSYRVLTCRGGSARYSETDAGRL